MGRSVGFRCVSAVTSFVAFGVACGAFDANDGGGGGPAVAPDAGAISVGGGAFELGPVPAVIEVARGAHVGVRVAVTGAPDGPLTVRVSKPPAGVLVTDAVADKDSVRFDVAADVDAVVDSVASVTVSTTSSDATTRSFELNARILGRPGETDASYKQGPMTFSTVTFGHVIPFSTSDGTLLFAATINAAGAYVGRLSTAGELDLTFGTSFKGYILNEGVTLLAAARIPGAGAVLLEQTPSSRRLVRTTAAGALDVSFGAADEVSPRLPSGVGVRADGSGVYPIEIAGGGTSLVRIFADNGYELKELKSPCTTSETPRLMPASDGQFLVRKGTCVFRITTKNTIDPMFGFGGVSTIPFSPYAASATRAGGIFALAGEGSGSRLYRSDATGAFGGDSAKGYFAKATFDVAPPIEDEDGKIYAVGVEYDPVSKTAPVLHTIRWTVDGAVDSSFGSGGIESTPLPKDTVDTFEIRPLVWPDHRLVIVVSYGPHYASHMIRMWR